MKIWMSSSATYSGCRGYRKFPTQDLRLQVRDVANQGCLVRFFINQMRNLNFGRRVGGTPFSAN